MSRGARARRAGSTGALFPLPATFSDLPGLPDPSGPAARVVAGVDEAGYGPLLGPLTIGWSVFQGAGEDLWRELAPVVSREPRDDGERLVVADSKVVFERNARGERRLETTALAFLALLDADGAWPRSARELLERCGSGLDAATEPWLARLPGRLPIAADEVALAALAERLRREAASRGIGLADAGARAIGVPALNASFAATGSKGRTHWDACAGLFASLWRQHAREGLDLVVDRHGGRKRYGPLLREALPDASVEASGERLERSEYAVREPGSGRAMRIAFAEKADRDSFAVALASCLAKYARELCMRAFNDHFGSLQPGLRPTAGYVTDARRWLAEAREAIERSGLPERHLVRAR